MKMRTRWEKGVRAETGMKGKHGGPVIKQLVMKILEPRTARKDVP